MQGQIKKNIGFAAILLLLLTALFSVFAVTADEEPTFTVEVKIVEGQDFGDYTIDPSSDSGKYTSGMSIKFTAIAKTGYVPTYEIEMNGDQANRTGVKNVERNSKLEKNISVTGNIVIYLTFSPKVYDVKFKTEITADGEVEWRASTVVPDKYTYGEPLSLPNPPDTTEYQFLGWSLSDKTKPDITGDFNLSPARGDGENTIELWAIYKPNQFKVTRLDKDIETGALIGSYEFMADFGNYIKADDTLLDLDENGNSAFREYQGYTYQNKTGSYNGNTVSVAGIVITRFYTPNQYRITYDPDGGSFLGGSGVSVTYNQAVPNLNAAALPTKSGYRFGGFWTRKDGYGIQYVDETGNGALWNIAENTTLYAYWIPETIHIDFSADLTAHATVKVKHDNTTYTYDGTPLSFAYGSEILIMIESDSGYKLVSWNGTSVEHTGKLEYTLTVPAEDQTLTGVVLPTCQNPDFRIDYRLETLTVDGSGRFELDTGNGTVTFSGGEKVSLSSYFGTTVWVRRCGDGTETAHSEWVECRLAARPAMPAPASSEEGGKVKQPTVGENSMLFELEDADAVDYEFAFRRYDSEGLIWQDSGNLTNLNAGTKYTFFIRVKATDTAPHGEEYSIQLTTLNEDYLKGKIEELRGKVQKTDGQNVSALIQSYVAKMEALPTGPNYQNEMEDLIRECEEKLGLARCKDKRIAEIEAQCEELRNGNLYNDAGKETLETLRTDAIAAICDAASVNGVDIACENFDEEVSQIPVRIDLTWLFVTLGAVILLQVIALVILLRRHAKYADRVKFARDGKELYGLTPVPFVALTAQFLPERSALVALLLGAVALILQVVIVILIFRTAAIAKRTKPHGQAQGTDGHMPAAPTEPLQESRADEDRTTEDVLFRPQLSVFRDDDAPSFEDDPSADGLQEEDWYDDHFEDETEPDTFESDDGKE